MEELSPLHAHLEHHLSAETPSLPLYLPIYLSFKLQIFWGDIPRSWYLKVTVCDDWSCSVSHYAVTLLGLDQTITP